MTTADRTTATSRGPSFDLWAPVWRLLTSVRVAVFYIATLATFGMLGVLIPQVPEAMRGNDAAIAAWLEVKRGTFGPFTDTMHRLGLFEVFHAKWFLFALGYLVVNVTTCVANRWSPTFRNVFRPPRRVPDSFFERAHNRTSLPRVDAAVLLATLGKLRYRVEATGEPGATYLFADRHPWTQLATFVSHLALILFISGGLVTWLTGFSAEIFTGEGTTAPLFAVSNPNQLQVRIDSATGRFGEEGNALDFRSQLTIFKNGEEVAHGTTTVNDPFKYGGYRFHQAAFFSDGAELRIRDLATGNALFHETFPLEDTTAAPAITISDAGGIPLLTDTIAPTDVLSTASGALVHVPNTSTVIWIGITATDGGAWQLVAYDPRSDDGSAGIRIDEGASGTISGINVHFDRVAAIPAAVGLGIPGGGGQTLAQLTTSADGADALMLVSSDTPALSLAPGKPVALGGLEYTFEGRRNFAGIAVKRDSGAWFIWTATAMLVGGLAITFYVPRRRLWVRLTEESTQIAALAEKSGGFEKDMRILAQRLKVPVPQELQEER